MWQVSYSGHGQDGPVVTWWRYDRMKKKQNKNKQASVTVQTNNKQQERKGVL